MKISKNKNKKDVIKEILVWIVIVLAVSWGLRVLGIDKDESIYYKIIDDLLSIIIVTSIIIMQNKKIFFNNDK